MAIVRRRLAAFVKWALLMASAVALQGGACNKTTGGDASTPSVQPVRGSRFLTDKREGLTRVNIKQSTADTKDMVFEPDYVLHDQEGSRFFGFVITIEDASMPLLQGRLERPAGSSPINMIAPATLYTQNTDPRDSVSRELSFILLNEKRADQELHGTPPAAVMWLQPSNVRFPAVPANSSHHRLGVLIPEQLVPTYPATTTVKIFTRPDVPATFQLTQQGTFDILAIGDSAAWGQGLDERNKYQSIVSQAVATELGRGVRLYLFAHSGAIVADPEGPSAPCTRAILDKELPGEVGDDNTKVEHRSTRIVCQAESFLDHPYDHKLDLIISNGCINDISAANVACFFAIKNFETNCASSLVNFFPLERPLENFTGVVDDKCGVRVRGLLNVLKRKFPGVPIVHMGYHGFKPAFFGGWDRLTAALGRLGREVTPETKASIETRADLWLTNSDRALSRAVAEANGDNSQQRSAIFASARMDNSPQPTLWEVADGPTPVDPMASRRRSICRALGRTDPACPLSSFAHTNLQGHVVHAKAAVDALKNLRKLRSDAVDPSKCIPGGNQPNQSMGQCGDMDRAYDPNCLLYRFEDPTWDCPL